MTANIPREGGTIDGNCSKQRDYKETDRCRLHVCLLPVVIDELYTSNPGASFGDAYKNERPKTLNLG